jgi:WD40 repeat protein
MVKSHRQPLKFVPSLLSQAARLARARFGAGAYQGDLDDLRNALVRALEAVKSATGRAVVVLDALDELEGAGERIGFLPEVLPAGVRVVLSCRPDIPLVQALRNRLRGLAEWALPPLSEEDLPALLERRLGAEARGALEGAVAWQPLFHRLQGNPLFLHRALDQIVRAVEHARAAGAAPRVDPDAFPATLDALFQDIYNEIAEKQGTRFTSAEGRHKARLLQMLCVAREPLGFEPLCELMAAAGAALPLEECRDRVLEMSQYLLDTGDNRFKPWHQGLAEFVRGQVLGEAGCREVEEVFCAWLRKPAPRPSAYALRHRASHLRAAEAFEELTDLLTDPLYLEAKAEAGLVYELAADFKLRRLPWDSRRRLLWLLAEALRADIHFIARHPTALFQCLWNRGWWYDCPDAAKHYLPPVGGWPAHGPPWEQPGPKLCTVLERWRAAKEQATPGFCWLRALRPPGVPLGSGQRLTFRGHTAEVRAVAFAPGIRLMVSGGDDRVVRIWDGLTSQELKCFPGHEGRVHSVAFAPDGRHVASGSEDHTVRLWDRDGGLLHCFAGAEAHRATVWCVAFAPDSRRLVSASRDRTVGIWDVPGRRLAGCLQGHTATVTSAAFSPDGRRVVSGSWDRTVRVWDAVSGAELLCLAEHALQVSSVAFSPDGGRVVSGGQDGLLLVWDALRGACLARRQLAPDRISSVAFSPDGRFVATGSCQRTEPHKGKVQVWDAQTLDEVVCRTDHEGAVHGVAFAHDGQHLASASWDRTVRVWDTQGGEAPGQLRGDAVGILCLAFSADGQRLVTGDHLAKIRLWDPRDGMELVCWGGHELGVRCVAFSPDGGRIISGSRDQTVRIWDAADGRELACLRGHEATVRSVAVHPDGRVVVSGSRDKTARVWDTRSGSEVLRLTGHEDLVNNVAFSPDGTRIATGELNGTIRLWDAQSGRELFSALRGQQGGLDSLAFSADGRRILSRSRTAPTRVWDATTGVGVAVLDSTADLGALVRSNGSSCPWWAMVREGELVLSPVAGHQAAAWFPVALSRLKADGPGRVWAGTYANRLYLFSREGAAGRVP